MGPCRERAENILSGVSRLSHAFQLFCSPRMVKSIYGLTTVSFALSLFVRPFWIWKDQLLLVNPWLAVKCLWAFLLGCPLPYSCPQACALPPLWSPFSSTLSQLSFV